MKRAVLGRTIRAEIQGLLAKESSDLWKFAAAIGKLLQRYIPGDLACLGVVHNHPHPHILIRDPSFKALPDGQNSQVRTERKLKIGGAELPPSERSMMGHVAATGHAEFHGDVSRARFFLPPRRNIQSEIVVPVVLNAEVLGVLNCESAQRNRYSEKHRTVLRAVARLIAPTLGKLLTQRGMRSTFAEVFRQLDKLLASVAPGILLEESDVLDKIAAVIGRSLQCHTCAIWLLGARSKLSVRGAFGVVEQLQSPGFNAARSLAINGMRPVSTGAPGAIVLPDAGSPRLIVPLLSSGKPVGVIEAADKGNGRITHDAFTAADQALLQALQGQIAVSIELRRADADVRGHILAQSKRISGLLGIFQKEELAAALRETVKQAPKLCNGRFCSIFLWDERQKNTCCAQPGACLRI